jgi:ferredoxin-thioredoxin reductase catalytic chain
MSEVEELRVALKNKADKEGIKFNINSIIVDGVLNGLIRNKEKHGEYYCPCRRVTKDKEADKKIVCPCIYHSDEIKKQGHCHCLLFVKKDV